jgi:NTE family protein
MEEIKTPKIGLALGSGGARGLAHIGVLKVLIKAKIPIHMVAGTSMGSIVGACYANDCSISKTEEIALKQNWREFLNILNPSLRTLKYGLSSGDKIKKLLYSILGNVKFEDLKIPFAVVATDIASGKEIIIKEGSVVDAIRASISIPAIFVPVKIKNRFLVDGGVTNPVPADVLKDMGADIVIASNVLTEPEKKGKLFLHKSRKTGKIDTPNIFKTIFQSIYILENGIVKDRIIKADVIIKPDVNRIEAYDMHKGNIAIRAGIKAAKQALPKIQEILEKYKTENSTKQ